MLYRQGHLDELRARAGAGDFCAAGWVAKHDRIQDLRCKATAGDVRAAVHYASLLAQDQQVEEAMALLRPFADSGEGTAAQDLADLLAEHGRFQELQSRADAGDSAAARKVALLRDHQRLEAEQQAIEHTAQQLVSQRRVDDLCRHVDANPDDIFASMCLAVLLQDNGDVKELRERADEFGDAAHALTELLAEHGRADDLIAELHAGNKWALSAWAGLLEAQGEPERAERLRLFGLNADGSIASACWPG